jgi:hypothetical protein
MKLAEVPIWHEGTMDKIMRNSFYVFNLKRIIASISRAMKRLS